MEICIIINTTCQGLLMNLAKTAVVVELAAVRGQFPTVQHYQGNVDPWGAAGNLGLVT